MRIYVSTYIFTCVCMYNISIGIYFIRTTRDTFNNKKKKVNYRIDNLNSNKLLC